MKKILFNIPTLFNGGAERVVSIWASNLAQFGYDVFIMVYGRCENEYSVDDKVKIIPIAPTLEKYKEMGYFKRLLRIRKNIKSIRPDVMLNFLPRMQIWTMLSSVGIRTYRIETVRNNPWAECKTSAWEQKLWLMCFDKANAVIVQTPEQRKFFSKSVQSKCVVIPNPISEECKQNFKSEYTAGTHKFIASGRLTEQKNYLMMFHAFAMAHEKYPEIQLSVFGTGEKSYIEKLKTIIEKIGAQNFIFLKGRTNKMVKELLAHDVYLMASNYEGMPNALAEAMACGLVCISTNCKTGPGDLIDNNKNGYLIDVGSAQQMFEKINQVMMLNPQQLNNIGKLARDKVLVICDESNSRNRLISLIEKGISRA